MTQQVSVGNVLYPVDDVDSAVKFYDSVLALPAKFQDGTRFAALDGGKVTVAIAGPEEDVTGDGDGDLAAVQRSESGAVLKFRWKGQHRVVELHRGVDVVDGVQHVADGNLLGHDRILQFSSELADADAHNRFDFVSS